MTNTQWILVVDDDPNDVDFTLRALTHDCLSTVILVANDGAEALDWLYRRHAAAGVRPAGQPAVVLLDLKMPKIDGLEVLRQVKNDALLKTIPVVMFSSSRESTDLQRSYELGANAYVVKPIGFQEFTATLKMIAAFWLSINAPPPLEVPDSNNNCPNQAVA
jgi:CheY-like chemotaxis protein